MRVHVGLRDAGELRGLLLDEAFEIHLPRTLSSSIPAPRCWHVWCRTSSSASAVQFHDVKRVGAAHRIRESFGHDVPDLIGTVRCDTQDLGQRSCRGGSGLVKRRLSCLHFLPGAIGVSLQMLR